MTPDTDSDVLIAGAGPSGLVLALWLARAGVRVRLIDRAPAPGTTSRALGVQARTLEFYRQLGIADEVVRSGLEFTAANFWVRGRHVARVPFGEMGKGVSPYPYMLVYPQDEHEPLLIAHLQQAGVAVERPLTLLTYTQDDDGVTARIGHPDGAEESCRTRYLVGCDGARSRVRELLGTGFAGGTYSHLFYVADVQAGGPVMNGELSGSLDADDFLAVFPMKGEGRGRFIGAVRSESAQPGKELSWRDVSAHILETMQIRVDRVNWFSTYHVHHRVADRWRDRRVFIAGDAAHIHSPVGGQGMNTGIGDVVNLGWKLAEVLKGKAGAELLDTYERERIGFAQRLVRTTDQIFVVATSPGPIARFVRARVLPFVLPRLMSLRAVQRFVFRTISQTAIHYRRSRLSSGGAGRLRGGDRLPWVTLDADPRGFADNFAPLVSRDWQLHVYGAAAPAQTEVPAFAFAWNKRMTGAGLVRGAQYLIRPDGYIARITPG